MAEEFKILFGADTGPYKKAVKDMQTETDKAVKGMSVSVGRLASWFAGLQVGGKLIDGLLIFSEFDDNLRKIGATAGATEEELLQLEKAALQVGSARPRELEEGLQVLVQQGLKASEAISALPGVVKLAKAENIGLAESAGIALGLMNSFGESVDALPSLLDKLLTGSQATAMGVLDYGEAIKKLGNVSGTFGANLDDMLAAVGLTRNAYIDASTAGAAMTSAMADLYNPVGQAAEALAVLNDRIGGAGIQVKTATGDFIGWASVIEQLEAAGASGAEVMKLFGKESGPTLAALMKQGSVAIRELTDEISNSGGAVDETAEKMESGLGGSLRRAQSEIEVAAIKLVKEFEPALVAAADAMKYAGTAADFLSGNVKLASAGVSAMAGAWMTIASGAEAVTDAVGFTDSATNSFADNAGAAFGSAGELADQAAMSFSGMGAEIEKANAGAAAVGEKVAAKIKLVSEATGITISSMEEFESLVQSGAVVFDESASAWINAETGKGASINETTEKINAQNSAIAEGVSSVEVLKKALSDMESETGYKPSAALLEEAAELERNAGLWAERGVAVEEINAAMYSKLTAMSKAAADQGQADTAASLSAMAAQYGAAAESSAEAVSDAYAAAYEKTGAFADEFFAAEEARIRERTDLLIEAGADAVEAEASAQREIAALRSKALSDMESETGYKPSAALLEEAAELERNAGLWAERGVAVEEINAAMYSKLTAMSKAAADQGQADTAASLSAMAAQYGAFAEQAETAEVTVEVDADVSAAEAEIAGIADAQGVTVEVDADTSSAEAALDGLQSSVETVAMSTYDYLTQLSTSSMLLNPGEADRQLKAMDKSARSYADSFRAEQLSAGTESIEQLAAAELQAHNDLADAKLRGTAQNVSEAEGIYADAIKARIDAEKKASEEAADAWAEAAEESAKAAKEAAKESAEAQKDSIQGQLDAAQEQLDLAKQAQEAYWDAQLDSAEAYYDEVKAAAEEAKDLMIDAAKEEYDNAISLIEKKIAAREDELSSAKTQLSALKQIYSESGAGGSQYFQAEADALARRAQEMKDQGIDQVLVEQWLNDELNDLRVNAAEAGVAGLDAYTQSILSSYQKTGEFSAGTVKLQTEIDKLKAKLAELKEGGYEQFFSDADYAALGFDSRLQSAQSNIDAVKDSMAEISGENFDFAGQSAESMANAVSVAEQQVQNLEASLKSVEEELKRISKIDTSFSADDYQPAGSSSGNSGVSYEGSHLGSFFTGPSYDVGGYTGNSAPADGFLAKLHNDEYIIPDASRFFKNLANSTSGGQPAPAGGSGGITLNIATVNVSSADSGSTEKFINAVVKKAIGANDISKLKQDMARHSKRSGL